LTDGSFTELVSGELTEGAEVIVGFAPDTLKTRTPQQKSGPRFGA
jgi:hypothetical protein